MKLTNNRSVIIKCLTEPNADCGGVPPYSASSIHYMLEFNFTWYGASRPVSISQINRTLRDLYAAGLITYEERLDDPISHSGLPQRVKYWQLADAVERNRLLQEVNEICSVARKAHGTFLFTKDMYFDKPMNTDQKNAVIKDLKALMQKTHPDKVSGFSDQFKQLKESLTYVRSNTDLLRNHAQQLG